MKHVDPRDLGSTRVPVIWSGPFGHHPRVVAAAEGQPLSALVAEAIACHGLPSRFKREGVICINGEVVPREMWRHIRPRLDSQRDVVITLHLPLLHGGGTSGTGATSKNPVATIAMIAVLAGSLAASGGLLLPAAIGTTTLIGSYTVAQALGAGILIGGSLAVAALVPPPRITTTQNNNAVTNQLGQPAALSGNVIQPDAAIPRVIGTRRVYPPAACEALNELINTDEYIESVFVLAGPHALSDPWAGETALSTIANVSFELQEGRQSSPQQSLVERYGKTLQINLTMSKHITVTDTGLGYEVIPDTTIDPTLPQWESVATRPAPDEAWIRLLWPSGLTYNITPATQVLQPMRVRFRQRGNPSWTNCPEIWWSSSRSGSVQKDIRFLWQPQPQAIITEARGGPRLGGALPVQIPIDNGPIYAFTSVPGQSGTVTTSGWTADPYFNGSPGTRLDRSNPTGASNITLMTDRVIIWLDPSIFMQSGVYEIQVIRGSGNLAVNFDKTTYVTSNHAGAGAAAVYDYFSVQSITVGGAQVYAIPSDLTNFSHDITIRTLASVYNTNPITDYRELACLAVRARGKSLDQISVLASGYTYDWDGSGWNTFTTTSNPVPHFRDILTGSLNSDPLPPDMVDDASLVAWRQRCIDKSYICDLVCDGKSAFDLLTVVAAAGYARPVQSETWGVTIDRDYSAQAPVQMFSPRNMAGFRFEKPFPVLPTGFYVRYDDILNDYIEDETIVFDPLNPSADTSRLEDMRYDVFVNEADAIARAEYDLMQAELRLTYYYGSTDAEALVCRRGDLVAVQHDVIGRQAGFSRVKTVASSGGSITGMTVDGSIPMPPTDAWANTAAAWSSYNNAWVAPRTGVAIRFSDDTVSVYEATPTAVDSAGFATSLSFVNPFLDPGTLVADCLVVSGALDQIYQRFLVYEIAPKAADFTADITLVPEAPQLWGNATGARIAREEGLLEGLTLLLDAGDGASYFPSGGSVWYDTSGQGNNFMFG